VPWRIGKWRQISYSVLFFGYKRFPQRPHKPRVNLSRTHIRTKLETPKPFWSATFFSSETVESSSLTATTRSFRRIRVFGPGRKSFTLTARSRSTSGGSAEYTIFFFITLLSFPPKGRSKNPDLSAPAQESDGHDLAEDFAKAKIPLFIIAVKRIVKDNTMLILECLTPRVW
jgi:hypothetical protein